MDTAVFIDPLQEIRAEIEEAAQDTTLDSETRSARLQEFHSDLMNLVTVVDTYLADEGLVREAEAYTPSSAVLKLRENADIRESLIATGTSPETCDDLMLYAHSELDLLAEEGLLEETALHAQLFMQHALKGTDKFDELKHPRGRGGKWRATLGHIKGLKDGDRKHLGNGVHVKKVGGKFQVQHHRRTISTHTTPENAASAAQAVMDAPPVKAPRARTPGTPPKDAITPGDKVTISTGPHRGKTGTVHSRSADGSLSIDAPEGRIRMHEDAVKPAGSETTATKDWIRKGSGATPTPEDRARVAAEHEQHKKESQLSPEEKTRLYNERKTALEQRAAESVKSAAQRGKLTDAEAHFNEAGKVSQRTLANYVEEASTKPQTLDMYSTVNSDGARVWDRSRKQLHERIIGAYLKKRKIDPTTGKPVLDYGPDAEDLQPHPDGPSVLFSGGGYAAGKGGVIKILGARGETPPDSFTLDPDQIKAELPEFQAMIGTDPEANMHVYREAWAIAQEIQARAMEKKLNLVVDGISDTSPEEMGQRAKAFTDRGYAARAVYVDIPTEEALSRAANRAVNAKDDSDRRMIPEVIMRAVHRDVAATVPSLPGYLEDHKIPLQLEVWDNHQGKDEMGEFRPPKQFFSYHPDTGREVPDQDLWDRFVGKGHESITHVEGSM